MFELSNRLVGIYKTFNTTKTITIIPKHIATKIEARQEERKRIELIRKVEYQKELEYNMKKKADEELKLNKEYEKKYLQETGQYRSYI